MPGRLFCKWIVCGNTLQAADKQLALIYHLGRQVVMQGDEELFVLHYFSSPRDAINVLQPIEKRPRKVQTVPLDVVVIGGPADRRFPGHGTSAYTINDPTQDANVLAESWPDESIFFVFPKPVYVEDAR